MQANQPAIFADCHLTQTSCLIQLKDIRAISLENIGHFGPIIGFDHGVGFSHSSFTLPCGFETAKAVLRYLHQFQLTGCLVDNGHYHYVVMGYHQHFNNVASVSELVRWLMMGSEDFELWKEAADHPMQVKWDGPDGPVVILQELDMDNVYHHTAFNVVSTGSNNEWAGEVCSYVDIEIDGPEAFKISNGVSCPARYIVQEFSGMVKIDGSIEPFPIRHSTSEPKFRYKLAYARKGKLYFYFEADLFETDVPEVL